MTFEEMKNQLFKSYLLRYNKNGSDLELIISSACNQQCEYCYLFKHGHEMYTKESNDRDNILNNLPILLDYLKKEKYAFKDYDIFSGEFFQLPFWEDVLEIIYNDAITYPPYTKTITIPTNMSWLLNDNITSKVESWYKKLDEVSVGFHISPSVDGPLELENIERPLNSKDLEKNNSFYDKLFSFLRDHNSGAHPMITKQFVSNYKQNYDFWIDNIKKYNCVKPNTDIYNIPMLLEVRDPDQWNSVEALKNYKDFLWYVAEKDLKELHNNDLKDFAIHMADDFTDDFSPLGKYCHNQPYILALPYFKSGMCCSIQAGLKVRVGDLAVVPCHRTCYPHMIYGNFILNDEKTQIIGEQGKHVELGYKIMTLNPNRSIMKCSSCSIQSFCSKGCLGSQYENKKELFAAQEEVCDLYMVKYKTIHEIAEHYGIYDIINNSLEIPSKRRETINYARKLSSNIITRLD